MIQYVPIYKKTLEILHFIKKQENKNMVSVRRKNE